MTTTTVDLQIFPLCKCSECIMEVERTLCGMDGVKVLSCDHENVKFTIETCLDPEEITDALDQHTFVGTSVVVSRRTSPLKGPISFDDMARELMKASRGNGLENVQYTQSTTIKMNYNHQPSTSRSARNVHDSEDGGNGYVNVEPPPQQCQPSTSGSAGGYEFVGGYGYAPPPPSAPPMPAAAGQGYVYGYPSEKKYMEDDCSGGCSTILWYLFYGILILLLVINIKSE